MRIFCFVCVFLNLAVLSQAQDQIYRGSIPEELLRPKQGEAAHYPVDIVIGELGQGSAPDAAYSFAKAIAAGLVSTNMEHPGLAVINADQRADYIIGVQDVYPLNYRIGGGREEADGAVSFMIRIMGRDSGIVGELFLRYATRQIQPENEEDEIKTIGSWKFEDLILEEARSREEERQHESLQRYDFSPYERFF